MDKKSLGGDNGGVRVHVVVRDLLFRSKILETARQVGAEVVADAAQADLVVFDLNSGDLEAIRKSTPARIIAFAGHLQADKLARAKELGCDVMTNGQLASSLPTLLRG